MQGRRAGEPLEQVGSGAGDLAGMFIALELAKRGGEGGVMDKIKAEAEAEGRAVTMAEVRGSEEKMLRLGYETQRWMKDGENVERRVPVVVQEVIPINEKEADVAVYSVLTPHDALGDHAILMSTHFSLLELVIIGNMRLVPQARAQGGRAKLLMNNMNNTEN